MTGGPTVGMVMIARDEADQVDSCFSSFWDHVDEVVLVDTGSKDSTVEKAREFAEARGEPDKLTVDRFEWCDDFAAARNHAHSLARSDWVAWCDLDDTVRGAQNLRRLAADAAPEVTAYVCDYDYARDEQDQCICRLRRERLLRNGAAQWHGRVHEAQLFEGAAGLVAPDVIKWVHRKRPAERPSPRNLRLLRAWLKDDPTDVRVLGYLGTEHQSRNQHQRAIGYFRRAIKQPAQPATDYLAQLHRKLALSLLVEGRVDEARHHGVAGLAANPSWPDSYLTLAQAAYEQQRDADALEFANEVLRRGVPETLLIVNPLDYLVEPKVVMAGALARLGRLDEAISLAEQALAAIPHHDGLREAYQSWRVQRKAAHTADTWVGAAQMLVAHDEQAKALTLLEHTVPYYVVDHPKVVELRSTVRERLAWARDPDGYADHYEHGGSKPEDFLTDEKAVEVCERLPRAHFLLAETQAVAA